jgi:uncharacterized membrane protein YgaE (UPF0421/DUF939 family)
MAHGRPGGSNHRGIWTSPEQRLVELRHDSQRRLRDRARRARTTAILGVQAGVAAGLAWFVADGLLHHPQPVFAPIAAVITLDISVGQRFRRAAELVFGVALGVAVGDALIYVIGTGAWQLALVVLLATVLSVFIGGTAAVVSQATTTAVLVATLSPPTTGIFYVRVLDALVGGLAALVVMALLLPINPLTLVSRTAAPACDVLADSLSDTTQALSARDAGRADAALSRLNEARSTLAQFGATVPEGRETATVAPLRWRARGALAQYVEAADYLERILSNARVLVRRSVTLINDEEPVPEQLPKSMTTLAEATREARRALARGATPHETRELAVQSVREAAEAYGTGLGFSGTVVVAQVRAIATDLLGVAGLPYAEANNLVRRAGGNPSQR